MMIVNLNNINSHTHTHRIYQLILSFILSLLINQQLYATPVNPQPGENLWHLTAGIGTELDELALNQASCCVETFTAFVPIFQEELTIESKIDQCCTTLNSKIDSLTQTVITDFAGTFTALAAIMCSTSTIACTARTVVSGTTTLSIGGSYCLSGDISANVFISGSGIVFDLNEHTISGIFEILGTAQDISILNGQINAPAAVANTDPFAFTIDSGAQNINVNSVTIVCANTTNASINGRSALSNAGKNVTIKNCLMQAGNGGFGPGGNNMAPITGGTGGSGGIGLNNSAENLIVMNSTIIGGNGGIGNAGANGISSNFRTLGGNGGNGGAGGVGLNNTGNVVSITKCKIFAGSGNSGGMGGNGNSFQGRFFQSGPGGIGGFGGQGANGLYNNGAELIVIDSIITAGTGAAGGTGGQGGNSFMSTPGGNGGNGGNGGSGGTGINNDTSSLNSQFIKSIIEAGLAGNGGGAGGGNSTMTFRQFSGDGGLGGAGGVGASNQGTLNMFTNCEIFGGAGGSGGSGAKGLNQATTMPAGNGGNGGNGGDGIDYSGSKSFIINCIIQGKIGGSGGDGGDNTLPNSTAGNGGNGGNGGRGVYFIAGNIYSLTKSNIKQTGNVGQGGAGGQIVGGQMGTQGSPGTNGAGGAGILISSSSLHTEIGNCIISNTGNGGFAINDSSTPGSSTIYTNFAYNIAVLNPYVIATGNAIDAPSGTAFGTGTDRLSNVYK